jgi:REP element-mobilizing transposase RayT
MPRLPRREMIDAESIGIYHIQQRCCRRQFLCGVDELTGKDYSFRKEEIQKRMEFLARFFAVDVLGFAIMSNHYHCVLRNRPDLVESWSDEEVARRWLHIFPMRRNKDKSVPTPNELEIQMLVNDSSRIKELRERLSSISWMMKCLAEVIARQANHHDKVTGHFWEGRFRCQPLLDEAAVLACMAYVDLNPVRAMIAETPEASQFTSAHERIQAVKQREQDRDSMGRRKGFSPYRWTPDCWLAPIELAKEVADETKHPAIFRASHKGCLPISLAEYLRILDWTGRQIRHGKRGAIPSDLAPILDRLGLISEGWVTMVTEFGKLFRQSAGSPTSLRVHAQRHLRQRVHSVEQSKSHFA